MMHDNQLREKAYHDEEMFFFFSAAADVDGNTMEHQRPVMPPKGLLRRSRIHAREVLGY
jgi:hypothetical protein